MDPPESLLMAREANDAKLKPKGASNKQRRPGDGREADPLRNSSKLVVSTHALAQSLVVPRNSSATVLTCSLDGSKVAATAPFSYASPARSMPVTQFLTTRSRCSSGSVQDDSVAEGPMHEQIELVDQYETRITFLENHNHQLIEEKMKLSQQLGVQTQVNNELKKLLVASIGDDLQLNAVIKSLQQYRVSMQKLRPGYERLVLDKTQADLELSHLHTVVQEDREQVEQALIQADVWRSKFLASRVMGEELSRWKSALYYKYKESHAALQGLLEEHSKIRALTSATKRSLVRIAEQLQCKDPSLDRQANLMTTLEIAFTNQDLADGLMHVIDGKIKDGELLLGLRITDDVIVHREVERSSGKEKLMVEKKKSDVYVEPLELSPAENLAQEVVLNCGIQTEELARMRKDYLAHNRISHFLSTNYHVTFNCCEECRGRTLYYL